MCKSKIFLQMKKRILEKMHNFAAQTKQLLEL